MAGLFDIFLFWDTFHKLWSEKYVYVHQCLTVDPIINISSEFSFKSYNRLSY